MSIFERSPSPPPRYKAFIRGELDLEALAAPEIRPLDPDEIKAQRREAKEERRAEKRRKKEKKQRKRPAEQQTAVVGPMPPPRAVGPTVDSLVSDKRIARRGEIGRTSEEISGFESQGYVMSGSRNRRMEAVRQKKESAVLTLEEQRVMDQMDVEAKVAREQAMIDSFKQMITRKTAK